MAKRTRRFRLPGAAALLAVLWLLTGCAGSAVDPGSASPAAAAGSAGVPSPQATGSTEPETSAPAIVPPSPSGSEDAPQAEASASESPEPDRSAEGEKPPASPSPSKPATSASPPPPAESGKPPASEQARTVVLSVVGNAEWGTIVEGTDVALEKNDTVADVLIRTLKAKKLSYQKTGSGVLFYVQGIDGLYEFDDGPTSGWKYRVNGKVMDVGAGSYRPESGDRIEWYYTSKDEEAEEAGQGKEPSA